MVTSLVSSGMSHAGFHINGQMQLQERLDGIYRRHEAFGNIRPRNMGLFYGWKLQRTEDSITCCAVAIGCDHAGEQVNCEDKSRGGLKGITRNENSRIRNYLAAPVLTQINQELSEKGGQISQTKMTHHQLRNPYVNRQNSRIISLVSVLARHDLGLEKSENRLKNLFTNQVMTEEPTLEIMNCEAIGSKINDEMIKERLQKDSILPVFSSIKKVMIKTFKRGRSKKRIQLQDRVIQLPDDANLWRKIALIPSSREFDYDNIIGHSRNLMTRDRAIYNGGHNKSSLMTEIKEAVGTNVTVHNPDIDCVAIDGMCMLNVIEKPFSIKTGADLTLAVCKWIDSKTQGCSSVIVAFDTYLEASLKKATRDDRKKKNNTKSLIFYDINATSNIARLSMSNILAHEKTKHALVEILLVPLQRHPKSRDLRYIVAGNHKTYSSDDDIGMANNHEEGETLLVYCLYIAPMRQDKNISVHATDTDIFPSWCTIGRVLGAIINTLTHQKLTQEVLMRCVITLGTMLPVL